VTPARSRSDDDRLAVEAALEIRMGTRGEDIPVTVTMRTPGSDPELALGFLLGERVVDSARAVRSMEHCDPGRNILRVELEEGIDPRLESVARTFAATASCGLCGKTTLEAVLASIPDQAIEWSGVRIRPELLYAIPARLRSAQAVFADTGGLHAVAAFDPAGELLDLREDVGRHNAFDKLVGAAALAGSDSLANRIVALSGRAGFELVQKAAVARAPMLVAIGAPSSLAVELAEKAGITLVGFLRADSFNVYCHGDRLELAAR
jgi:FdhD protein